MTTTEAEEAQGQEVKLEEEVCEPDAFELWLNSRSKGRRNKKPKRTVLRSVPILEKRQPVDVDTVSLSACSVASLLERNETMEKLEVPREVGSLETVKQSEIGKPKPSDSQRINSPDLPETEKSVVRETKSEVLSTKEMKKEQGNDPIVVEPPYLKEEPVVPSPKKEAADTKAVCTTKKASENRSRSRSPVKKPHMVTGEAPENKDRSRSPVKRQQGGTGQASESTPRSRSPVQIPQKTTGKALENKARSRSPVKKPTRNKEKSQETIWVATPQERRSVNELQPMEEEAFDHEDEITMASVFKESRKSRTGISLRCDAPGGNVFVSGIAKKSLFSDTGLRVGDEIMSVNSTEIHDASAAADLIRGQKGSVTVVARRPSQVYSVKPDQNKTLGRASSVRKERSGESATIKLFKRIMGSTIKEEHNSSKTDSVPTQPKQDKKDAPEAKPSTKEDTVTVARNTASIKPDKVDSTPKRIPSTQKNTSVETPRDKKKSFRRSVKSASPSAKEDSSKMDSAPTPSKKEEGETVPSRKKEDGATKPAGDSTIASTQKSTLESGGSSKKNIFKRSKKSGPAMKGTSLSKIDNAPKEKQDKQDEAKKEEGKKAAAVTSIGGEEGATVYTTGASTISSTLEQLKKIGSSIKEDLSGIDSGLFLSLDEEDEPKAVPSAKEEGATGENKVAGTTNPPSSSAEPAETPKKKRMKSFKLRMMSGPSTKKNLAKVDSEPPPIPPKIEKEEPGPAPSTKGEEGGTVHTTGASTISTSMNNLIDKTITIDSTGQANGARYHFFVAAVSKNSYKDKTGVGFKKHPSGYFVVHKIIEDGLFSKTDLQVGDEVMSVNGIGCTTMSTKAVASLFGETKETIVLFARRKTAAAESFAAETKEKEILTETNTPKPKSISTQSSNEKPPPTETDGCSILPLSACTGTKLATDADPDDTVCTERTNGNGDSASDISPISILEWQDEVFEDFIAPCCPHQEVSRLLDDYDYNYNVSTVGWRTDSDGYDETSFPEDVTSSTLASSPISPIQLELRNVLSGSRQFPISP